MSNRAIGLALGGGSARGLAHIGVLQYLEELQIDLAYIAGTSSGSIIGALYASGYSTDDMIAIAKGTSWRDLSRLVVPRRSLLNTDRMEQKLEELLQGKHFEEMDIPFVAVCTDLYSGSLAVLLQGSVAKAVRASCSLPGIFPPVAWEDYLLVDGGLIENVPVRTVREMGAEFVLAVDLYASMDRTPQADNVIGVLLRSFEISQHSQCLSLFQTADVCIEPRLAGESLVDLSRVDEYVAAGYDAAMACHEQLLHIKQLAGQSD